MLLLLMLLALLLRYNAIRSGTNGPALLVNSNTDASLGTNGIVEWVLFAGVHSGTNGATGVVSGAGVKWVVGTAVLEIRSCSTTGGSSGMVALFDVISAGACDVTVVLVLVRRVVVGVGRRGAAGAVSVAVSGAVVVSGAVRTEWLETGNMSESSTDVVSETAVSAGPESNG